MGDARYSFSLTTFSPTGKLVQIEYALQVSIYPLWSRIHEKISSWFSFLQAVQSGHTSIGIKAKGGVVIASEKKLPDLMESSSVQKIASVRETSLVTRPFLLLIFRAGHKAYRTGLFRIGPRLQSPVTQGAKASKLYQRTNFYFEL